MVSLLSRSVGVVSAVHERSACRIEGLVLQYIAAAVQLQGSV